MSVPARSLLETPPPARGHRRTLSAESTGSQVSLGTFCYDSFNTLKDLAAPTPARIEYLCARKCHTVRFLPPALQG